MTGQTWDFKPSPGLRLLCLQVNAARCAALGLEYQQLPECVKTIITERDYNGMGHEQRASLIEDMTTPDEPEDE